MSGTIFSIHDRAVNISSAGPLVSVIVREEDMTALAIRVDKLQAFIAGEPVELAGRTLRRPGEGPLCRWNNKTADFTGEIVRVELSPHEVQHRLKAVSATLQAEGNPAGLLDFGLDAEAGSVYSRRAREIVPDVGNSAAGLVRGRTDARSCGEIVSRLSRIVGLGPGFTPAGDDFVCGALASIACLVPGCRTASVAEPVRERLTATTPGGAALLYLACLGSFPRYLCSFVKAFASRTTRAASTAAPSKKIGSTAALDRACRAALEHGATSGADTLAGFVWAARQLGFE